MYQGKRYKRSRRRSTKSTALLVSLLLLLCVTVGGTIAFLMDSDGSLGNIFNPSKVKVEVEETVNGNTKSDVYIKNTGDTEAWIRVAIAVTWKDNDGNTYGQAPKLDKDYVLNWGAGDWYTGSDGFEYYRYPVTAGEGTGTLIKSISLASTANVPEGYSLNVEIIASGIQSKPAHVFTDVWGSPNVSVNSAGTELVKFN